MSQKRDPKILSALDPEGFKRAKTEVEKTVQGMQVLLREEVEPGETVQYIYGPLPLNLEQVDVAFQVVWFGTSEHPWPLDEHTPTPMLKTETPNLGRMVLWRFTKFEQGAELLAELWDLVPEPPEVQ